VAEFLPGFQDRVREALKILLGEKGAARIRMGLAKDGSGVGGKLAKSFSWTKADEAAALTALQAKKALDKRVNDDTHKGSKEAPGQTKANRS
jgi:hexokinase